MTHHFSLTEVLRSTSAWGFVDLLVVVVVALSVTGALRRRAGLLGAAGAGLAALLLSWLTVGVLAAITAGPVGAAAESSRLLHLIPAPQHAITQATSLVQQLLEQP